MQNNKLKVFESIDTKTKVYLTIIAILTLILFMHHRVYIISGVILYILIILYTVWTYNKRKGEISTYIEELTISVDSAAKNTLINSPFPIIVLETDGNVIFRCTKFNKEFANVGINTYIDDIAKEIKLEVENKKEPKINKKINISEKTYNVIGHYVKIKQKDKKETSKYMTILYFMDATNEEKLLKKYNNSKTCVGIIMIDNYEEIIQRMKAEEKTRSYSKY
jgi:c-di-AMP phosphodiesterase-like protein